MLDLTKFQNKFIITVVILIIIIISFQAIKSNKIDRNSYINLISGEASITSSQDNKNIILNIGNRRPLSVGDVIKTTTSQTLAIIEWGDGSITRMGGIGELKITSNFVSQDTSKINISFDLIKGKTWSNVISFMGSDSYFKASYADKEAAVRGTAFELNADLGYLYVDKHEVKVTNSSGETSIVKKQEAFDLNKFSLIALIDFIKSYQDKAWLQINEKLDSEFIQKLKSSLEDIDTLKNNLISTIGDEPLQNLSLEQSKQLYDKVLEQYQKLDFISPEDKELYKTKLEYKKVLSSLAPEEDKQNLAIKTLYDFADFNKGNYDLDSIKDTVSIIALGGNNNADLNLNFDKILEKTYFPENIKEQIIGVYNAPVFDILSGETQKIKSSFDFFLNFIKNLFKIG